MNGTSLHERKRGSADDRKRTSYADRQLLVRVTALFFPRPSDWGRSDAIDSSPIQSHDRRAEAAVIKLEFGTVAEFLVAKGYGPGAGRSCNAMEELEKFREREKAGE